MSNLDMFGEVQSNTVQVTFLEGQLSVVITGQLDKVQRNSFRIGALNIPGIKECQIDTFAPHSDENTAFILTFRSGLPGATLLELPHTVQAYAESFLREMQPTARQVTLF